MTPLLVGALAVTAGTVQNIVGFGAGIIMMMVFPQLFGMLLAPALNTAICGIMTIVMAWRFRKYIQWDLILVPMVCFLTTGVASILLVGDMDRRLLGIAFGCFLILLSIYFMFIQSRLKPVNGGNLLGAACGLVSGLFSGLFSVGAPTMALYFLSVTRDRNHYMGNLQMLLAVGNVVTSAARVSKGLFPPELILPTLFGFVGILIGQRIGARITSRMDPKKLNKFIYLMVFASGLNTLIKQL